MLHCQLLQAGEIQAVVGDASRDGVGGTQYCGLWSLTSKRRVLNVFGNSYAGLIPGVLRGQAPQLEIVNETTCALNRKADKNYAVNARAIYQIVPPYSIDHTLTFTDLANACGAGCNFREVSWCSYMNHLEDPHLYFRSQNQWHRYISPRHGVGSNIAPAYIAETELEKWPLLPEEKRPFHWSRYERRFDQPFYYGRIGDMALIFVFNTPRWLRFFCSPTGGGPALISDRHCPAWDFEWIIPDDAYTVGKAYEFRMRLIYKPFVSEADVLDEVNKAQRALLFEREPTRRRG